MMRRLFAGVLVALAALSTVGSAQVQRVVPKLETTAPKVIIVRPVAAPTYDAPQATIQVEIVALDDVLVTSGSWQCLTCTTTTGSVGTFRTAGGVQIARFPITVASGANTLTVTVQDAGAQTGTDTMTITLGAADVIDPNCTITTLDHTVSSTTTTVVGQCTDNVAVTEVSWLNTGTGATGLCLGNGSEPSCPVSSLVSGANTIQIIGKDAANNVDETPPSITVTLVADVTWITPASLGTVNVAATTRQLECSGGVGDIDYAVTGGSLGDGSLNGETGVLTYPNTEAAYSFTVRCTDSAGSPDFADRTFSLTVSNSAETSHQFFNDMVAFDLAADSDLDPGTATILKSWSLRTGQDDINALDTGSVENEVWMYEYDDGDPLTRCHNNTCSDSSFNAVKYYPPPFDPAGSNHVLRFTAGDEVSNATFGDSVTIFWEFYYPDAAWRVLSDLCNVSGTTCPAPKKQFGFNPLQNLGGTSALQGVMQFQPQNNDQPGQGSGASSLGTVEVHSAGLKLAPHGANEYDPYLNPGEGAAAPGAELPLDAAWHYIGNVWHRYAMRLEWRVRQSSSVFDKFRAAHAGFVDADGKIGLTGCTVSAAVATCTAAAEWVGLKAGGGYRAVAGETFIIHVENAGHAGLNGEKTATIVDSLHFTFNAAGVPDLTAGGGYLGGTFDPEWVALSVWGSHETQQMTRLAFRMPWRWPLESPYLQFTFAFDSSTKYTRTEQLYGYARNVVMLKNLPLNLNGVCANTVDTAGGTVNERGNCIVDATNNPSTLGRLVVP
jgi:hypothetical protein